MEKSSFFNSVQAADGSYDREYLAEDFAKYFASFIGNGVFPNPSSNLQVLSNNDMTISIDIGKAFINGYYYENTTKLVKAIDICDGRLNRIDLVVLRLDFTNREIKTYVKKGTFASSPKAETLQRDSDMYELGLAKVYIKAGATSITQADITDLRLDTDNCGVVTDVVNTVDTSTLFAQYMAWYNEKISEFEDNMASKETEFDNAVQTNIEKYKKSMEASEVDLKEQFVTWFESIKGQLSTDAAGNLQNQVDELKASKSEIITGTATMNSTELAIENQFITANTFAIISPSGEPFGTWTWTTEDGKLTIESDFPEDNIEFNYCLIKGGE